MTDFFSFVSSFAMSPETEFFAAIFCFAFAIFYFVFQVIRLLCPVWAWRFEKNGTEAIEALKASSEHTAKSLATATPTQACFARLVKAQNLTDEEKLFKRRLQQKLFMAAAAAALVYYIRFSPELPEQADSYATDLLLVALGMSFSALANYRIFRTMRLVTGAPTMPLPEVNKGKKTKNNDQNAAQ